MFQIILLFHLRERPIIRNNAKTADDIIDCVDFGEPQSLDPSLIAKKKKKYKKKYNCRLISLIECKILLLFIHLTFYFWRRYWRR